MGPHDSTNPRHELVIALGDPAGIGMEVVLEALASPTLPPEGILTLLNERHSHWKTLEPERRDALRW